MGTQYDGYDEDAIDALQALSDEVHDLKSQLESAREVAHSFRRRLEQAQVENARLRSGAGHVPGPALSAFIRENEHTLKYKGGKTTGFAWSCTCGRGSTHTFEDKDERTWEATSHLASTIS